MPAAWAVLLVATPFLAAFYLLLPGTGPSRVIAYPAFGLIGMLAILIGIHRRRPARLGSWRLMAVALALLSLGDITYSVLALDGQEIPYPSLADVAYLAAHAAPICGSVGLIRGRVPGGDRTPVIDAAILAAGAGSLFWFTVVQPSLQGTVEPLAVTVSLVYPALDIILLALGLRVLMTRAARPRFLEFIVVGISVYLVADVIYAMAVLDGTYAEGQAVDGGWIVGILLVGVAALHPSVSNAASTVEARETRLSRRRFALLAVAALVAPVIVIVHEAPRDDGVVLGLVLQWVVLFALVLVRLATTVDELAISLRERRRLQGDLTYQAHHDPLTRLANRSLFEQRLAQAVATAPETTAVVFLDLDDFKTINDTLGHPRGDEVLRVLARRVQGALRGDDLAARVGGDEFAIVLEGCTGEASARAIAERILHALRPPVSLDTRQVQIHASAGVALGHAGSTVMDLMRDADIAMYYAKSHGKDHVETYVPEMQSQVRERFELHTEFAQAIKAGSFVLHYQPVVGIEGGGIVGAEALVRWDHASRGLLGPDQFLAHAETSGLIQPLGRWILREACATAAGWPSRPDGQRAAISVNLAATQLCEPGLVGDVAAILAATGLPAHLLILEVTESALVDLDTARLALVRLRELGVQLALDDFGTGYSSLSYLAELPFDIVKIDRSFTASIGHGRRVDALLHGVVSLCEALDLVPVAEGIETEAQRAHLLALGCRIGQGYLFSRPVPAAAFLALLSGSPETRQRPSRGKRPAGPVGRLPTTPGWAGLGA